MTSLGMSQGWPLALHMCICVDTPKPHPTHTLTKKPGLHLTFASMLASPGMNCGVLSALELPAHLVSVTVRVEQVRDLSLTRWSPPVTHPNSQRIKWQGPVAAI